MSYLSIVQMAGSQTLQSRIAAAAAEAAPRAQVIVWAQANLWRMISSPGWSAAWQYAVDTATAEHNPDTGARPGVISDAMIRDAVARVLAEDSDDAAPPASGE